MRHGTLPIIAGAAFLLVAGAANAATLDDIKAKGFVQCGVHTGLAGFAAPDDAGTWTGLDVDYCRAVASAIFNDPQAVKFSPLSPAERFAALQSGEVDMLARITTWTMARDTPMGLIFAGINYFDGQSFMVRKSLGIASALELSGADICVQTGTTTELNLADYFKLNNMNFVPVVFDRQPEAVAAYDTGRCDVYTTDASGLYSTRLSLTNPDDHVVLPEIISKEPFGLMVRQGDDQWLNLVKWVHYALLNAEELGVTQANVEEMKTSESPDIRRLLGTEGEFGAGIGLGNDWAANAIRAVGNYGEMFNRNVGSGSPLQIARGLNALWTNGGIHYAPPIR